MVNKLDDFGKWLTHKTNTCEHQKAVNHRILESVLDLRHTVDELRSEWRDEVRKTSHPPTPRDQKIHRKHFEQILAMLKSKAILDSSIDDLETRIGRGEKSALHNLEKEQAALQKKSFNLSRRIRDKEAELAPDVLVKMTAALNSPWTRLCMEARSVKEDLVSALVNRMRQNEDSERGFAVASKGHSSKSTCKDFTSTVL
jgi:hypothetical protein